MLPHLRLLKKIYYLFLTVPVFVAAHRLSLIAVSNGYSLLGCVGFPLWWLLLLWSMGSGVPGFQQLWLPALEHRPSSCGSWA